MEAEKVQLGRANGLQFESKGLGSRTADGVGSSPSPSPEADED